MSIPITGHALDELRRDRQEKESKAYQQGMPPTTHVMELAEFVSNVVGAKDSLLEIGCGRGQAVEYLVERGYNCKGCDITTAGMLKDRTQLPTWFAEVPVWDMPYEDNEFEFTFSTDVMEHVPPTLVEQSIREIYRVTRTETFHAISNLPNTPQHASVHPVPWWKIVFKGCNDGGIRTHIMESRSSPVLFHFVNERGAR